MTTSVRIVGTGLIGTSLGIALSRAGYAVVLADPSPTAVSLARDLGAGAVASDGDTAPDIVVVAAPPDVAGSVVADELAAWPDAVVTDVASVKVAVLEDVRRRGGDLTRYAGSHPMAGRERSGAVAARGDLFDGRAWVVVPNEQSSPSSVEAVTALATAAGGTVSTMDPAEHDAAVAVVSHVPQLASSLVAGRLRDLTDPAVALSGQGIRDVTRVAASDPQLWTQILAGNASAVREVLAHVHAELTEVIGALDVLTDGDGVGAREVLARIVAQGNAGHARIPGKHGAAPTAYSVVVVLVPDRPGELARLLHDVGDAGVNLEDLHLEHGLGQPFGLAEVSVLPAVAERLGDELTARGWRLHG
ncbi:prephenate dehydrogenase [Phycicoccus sp. Soil803]|uniref:prephenate dehydrogenase n=1 Tax=Phycicoccus sp. Soil803 TaxID=1736415 RepID=UPI00070DD155|nr:prephenate dehydrogenase [Phycicoccus sp. Soil803]KRF25033.1 prephenate dehydrogenase [Phycicoccus sp. Soil803]